MFSPLCVWNFVCWIIAVGQPIKLKNLKASTNYTVQVRAKNEVGAGEPYDLLFATDPTR